MKLCEVATDAQIGIFALLAICLMAVITGTEGSKDIMLMVAGAIAGWISKTGDQK
jgi:hypothetical protein